MGGPADDTKHQVWFEIFLEYFHINIMFVAPSSINSLETFWLFSNTILPLKSLIAIILGGLFVFDFWF